MVVISQFIGLAAARQSLQHCNPHHCSFLQQPLHLHTADHWARLWTTGDNQYTNPRKTLYNSSDPSQKYHGSCGIGYIMCTQTDSFEENQYVTQMTGTRSSPHVLTSSFIFVCHHHRPQPTSRMSDQYPGHDTDYTAANTYYILKDMQFWTFFLILWRKASSKL